LLSACTPQAASTPQDGAALSQALPNLAYPIEAASSGTAQLKDGLFEAPAAPGSAAVTRIQLGPAQAFGDINGDGALRVLPAAFIGDRVVVRSLSIQPGQVVVDLLTRAADEPMSVEPTDQQRLVFNLSGGQLVQQGSS
jgi:hypothetical protein